MESQRRIDPRGILKLAGVGVLFGAVAVYVVLLTANLGTLPIVLVGVTAAAAGVLVQYWEWERLGGRANVIATNEWIRARTIPSSIPRDVWVPLLLKREARALRNWVALVAVALQILLAVHNLVNPTSTTHPIFWICALSFWAGIVAWTLYYNLRWLPVIRQLLRQRSTAETLPVPASQHDLGSA